MYPTAWAGYGNGAVKLWKLLEESTPVRCRRASIYIFLDLLCNFWVIWRCKIHRASEAKQDEEKQLHVGEPWN